MRTIVLAEPGRFEHTTRSDPEAPHAGEALVRVAHIGICGTDLHAFGGRQPFFSYPRVLGHELGVEVVALGPPASSDADHRLKVGDRCAVEPYLNCGECTACRRGRTNCCESLQVLGVHEDGGMCEWLVVPVNKLHPSATLPLSHLAVVEMLCIGAHAVGRGNPAVGEEVLVIGAGPIGLATAQFACLTGANVTVLEVSAPRRKFCQEHLPVARVLDGATQPMERLKSALGGDLPTMVFDATGNPNSMNAAFNYVANSGTLVLVGLVQGDLTFNDPEFHRREMTLLSSRNATAHDFKHVIGALESGQFDIDPWITHHSGPDDLPGTFPTWLSPEAGVVKAMLEMTP